MATLNPNINERRHIPERRTGSTTATNTAASASSSVSARSMSAMDWIAMVLLIVGGVNWGLVGLMDLDLVATLFGDMTPMSRLVYVLVGLAALYSVYTCSKMARR